MFPPHRSSRLTLVASERSATDAGPVPVRRYRLARMRVSPTAAAPAARLARAKRP